MRFIAALLILFTFMASGFAQEKKPVPVKFLEIDEEDTEIFISGMREFLRKLAASPKTTTGFVAIAHNVIERRKIAKDMVKGWPAVKDRVGFSLDGTHYNKGWENTEFWLVPKGAEQPYIPFTADCSCPTSSVVGEVETDKSQKELTFTGNVSGGAQDNPLTYHWVVAGGEIIRGQGTPSIIVVVRNSLVTSVTATLIIGGYDEDCMCSNTASFTTRVVR